jgi:hypothetical protein
MWCTDFIGKQGELGMSISSHVQELKKKHKSLSSAVEHAQQAPSSNTLRIMELKKQKLRLKEEITRLDAEI